MYDMWGAGFWQLMFSVAGGTLLTVVILKPTDFDVEESFELMWSPVMKSSIIALLFYFLVPVITDEIGMTNRNAYSKWSSTWSPIEKKMADRIYGKSKSGDASFDKHKNEAYNKALPATHWILMNSYLFVLLTIGSFYLSYNYFIKKIDFNSLGLFYAKQKRYEEALSPLEKYVNSQRENNSLDFDSIIYLALTKKNLNMEYDKDEIKEFATKKKKLRYEDNYQLYQALEDNSFLETSYKELKKRIKNDTTNTLVNYDATTEIIKEWEKVNKKS